MIPLRLALALLALAPMGVAAQRFSLTGGVSSLAASWLDSSGAASVHGVTGSVAGRVSLGPLGLAVALSEGRLRSVGAERAYAEGQVALDVDLGGGFALTGGPAARVLVDGGEVTRWVQWRFGGLYEAPLTPGPLSLYAGAWGGTGARSGIAAPSGSALGGVLGLRLTRGPWRARLEYAVDEARAAVSDRLTVERLTAYLEFSR